MVLIINLSMCCKQSISESIHRSLFNRFVINFFLISGILFNTKVIGNMSGLVCKNKIIALYLCKENLFAR